jgi:ABC-type branched-subunit amino acid transport system substrate-binding protein
MSVCARAPLFCSLLLLGCRQIAGIDDLAELDHVRRMEDTPCASSKECSERFAVPTLCRARDARCVPLLSDDCDGFTGDPLARGALIFGSIQPTTGLEGADGRSLRRALGLAVEDFELGTKGLPPLTGEDTRRPLAIVHCNDRGQSENAVRAARHLAETLEVPAIVGASFSGVTLAVATSVTIAHDTLLMSPSATSSAISELEDHGLVWRTAPSDVVQASAQVALIERLAEQLQQGNSVARPLTIAILHKGDAYGYGLAEDVLEELTWNGRRALDARNAAYVARKDYGDPSNVEAGPLRYERVVRETLALAPDVVLLYGTSEVASDVLTPLEAGWPASAKRPYYVLADGGRTDDTRAAIEALDPDGTNGLAERLLGTEPGAISPEQALFAGRYASAADDPEEPVAFGAANAYDAVHLLAYAAVAADRPMPSGSDLAAGLVQFLPRAGSEESAFSIGPRSLNAVFRALKAGQRLLLAGASGPLRFDLDSGDVMSDILLWCPQRDAAERLRLITYGERYDVTSHEITAEGELQRCGR